MPSLEYPASGQVVVVSDDAARALQASGWKLVEKPEPKTRQQPRKTTTK